MLHILLVVHMFKEELSFVDLILSSGCIEHYKDNLEKYWVPIQYVYLLFGS